MRQYPYFINPDIDALPSASPEERTRLVRRIAACVGDEAALRAIIGIDPAEFASFYPDMQPPELSTEATIDSFINRFSSEQAAEAPEIEELVVAPAIDYATLLESESDDSADSDPTDLDADPTSGSSADSDAGSSADPTADLISSFLKAVPPKTPGRHSKPAPELEHKPAVPESAPAPERKPESAPESAPAPELESVPGGSGSLSAGGHRPAESSPTQPADSSLSEELFKLMVKNGNYTKALEIINELSLNNPKKSIYFAYQMRFLKKLIKNQENAKS